MALPLFVPVPGASRSLPSHPSSLSLCHSECGRRGSADGTGKTATHTIWPGRADGKQNPQESRAEREVQVCTRGMAEDGPQLAAAVPIGTADVGSQLPSPFKGSGCVEIVVFQPRELCCSMF